MKLLLALISRVTSLLQIAAYAASLPDIQVSTVEEEMLYNPRLTKDEVIILVHIHVFCF